MGINTRVAAASGLTSWSAAVRIGSGWLHLARWRMSLLLILLCAFLTPGLGPGVLFAQGASAFGYSGLMLVPTAELARDGEFAFGVNRIPELYAVRWYPNRRTVFWGRMGLFPFLEAGGMFVRPDHYNAGFGDRSLYFKLKLLPERHWLPALAVGSQDFFAIERLNWYTDTRQHFGSVYAVVSKHLTIKKVPLYFSLGYGPDWTVAKTKMLVGWFGGVTWAPHRMLTVLAEYDARSLNAGIRLQPLPYFQLQYAWWQLRAPCITAAVLLPLK